MYSPSLKLTREPIQKLLGRQRSWLSHMDMISPYEKISFENKYFRLREVLSAVYCYNVNNIFVLLKRSVFL